MSDELLKLWSSDLKQKIAAIYPEAFDSTWKEVTSDHNYTPYNNYILILNSIIKRNLKDSEFRELYESYLAAGDNWLQWVFFNVKLG